MSESGNGSSDSELHEILELLEEGEPDNALWRQSGNWPDEVTEARKRLERYLQTDGDLDE